MNKNYRKLYSRLNNKKAVKFNSAKIIQILQFSLSRSFFKCNKSPER